eukprot:TRINITY_DN1371_c1_g1_i3.p1 TRINITY_DN1371_c1_g1~~TRINITY_DN1371_c1_g1_i3.p1  ORF type:complete len:102 (-),score=10.77 TRINITY_DN1371_c1_g1_i3:302-607(-)
MGVNHLSKKEKDFLTNLTVERIHFVEHMKIAEKLSKKRKNRRSPTPDRQTESRLKQEREASRGKCLAVSYLLDALPVIIEDTEEWGICTDTNNEIPPFCQN